MTIWPIQEKYFFDVQSFYLFLPIAYLGWKEFRANLATGKTIRGERVWNLWTSSHNFNIVTLFRQWRFWEEKWLWKWTKHVRLSGNRCKMGCFQTCFSCWIFQEKTCKNFLGASPKWWMKKNHPTFSFPFLFIDSSKFVGKHIFCVLHWPLPGFSSVLPEYFPHFWKILDVSYIWYLQQV